MYLTCCRLCDSEWSQMFVENRFFYKHTTRLRVAPLQLFTEISGKKMITNTLK